MGTYEGLSVPLFGEFYRYSEAKTQNLYVEDDGVINITIANPGADNCVALTVTDTSTAFTSGYLQGYYLSLTTDSTSSYTTGNSQINGIAMDIELRGTVGCEAEGIYIYMYGSTGKSTLSDANISGMVIYMASMGSTASYQQNLFLHWDESASPTYTSYILCKGENDNPPQAFAMFHGAHPDYFVKTISAAGDARMIQSISISTGTQDKVLACHLNGSTYWIPLYAASA